MKPSIWQRAAKRFEDGVEEFGCCRALSNLKTPYPFDEITSLKAVFNDKNLLGYYFGQVLYREKTKEAQAANNHRIIALLLMHELERTGDLKKIIEQERK